LFARERNKPSFLILPPHRHSQKSTQKEFCLTAMFNSRITPESVFLVSGGARGITAKCVVRMAQVYRCRFILLGRSPLAADPAFAQGVYEAAPLKKAIAGDLTARGEKALPASIQKIFDKIQAGREIAQTLAAINEAGGMAEYVSVDVTDVPALRAAVAQTQTRLGVVTGLLHGAGNLADKRIEQKTEKDFESVYAAKVDGLNNMLAAVDTAALRHIILYSSVAGFFGNIGQADYALANEILNKAAYRLRRTLPNCRVIAIDWGPWEGGMVTPQLKQFFESQGIRVIPVEVGAEMLIDELENGADAQIVVGGALSLTPAQPDSTLRTHIVRRPLRLNDSPILMDHVVNGAAVLPMVCSISWVANTCEGLYPGFRFGGYEGYKVLKGIVFDDTIAPEYTLELKETEKTADHIRFAATVSSRTADGKMRYHYKVDPIIYRVRPEAAIYPRIDLSNTRDIDGLPLYETKIVFHGQSFRGVKRVLNMTTEHITMHCKMPAVSPEYQGAFPVQAFNYFAVDAALQSLGIFARLTYEMGSLPLETGRADVYRGIPFEQDFYVSLEPVHITESIVIGDIYIHDEQGRCYITVQKSQITLMKHLIEMFLKNTLPQPIPVPQITTKPQ
jgi:NAD(P)-dependent dehydrogenase (short-subunit alcohol dehydrogenase family)